MATLEEAKARAAKEFAGKEKATAGYPPEEPPAPPREIQWAWVQQHPPPLLVVPPPPRPPTLLQRNHRGPFYNKENSRFQDYDPPALIPTLRLDDFVKSLVPVTSHSLTPKNFNGPSEFFPYPNQTPTLPSTHLFLPRKALLR